MQLKGSIVHIFKNTLASIEINKNEIQMIERLNRKFVTKELYFLLSFRILELEKVSLMISKKLKSQK